MTYTHGRAIWVVWLVLGWFGAELVLRTAGHEPYKPVVQDVRSTPPGCLVPDERLGFALGKGRYDVRVRDDLAFVTTQTVEGHRITRANQTSSFAEGVPAVLVTGGSFTYGYGVDDHESYPYLLQTAVGDFNIINGAAPGHGTVQAILQLEDLIARGEPPAVVIVNYLSFHDERNALAPSYAQLLRDVFLPEDGIAMAIEGSAEDAARRSKFPRLVHDEERWRVDLVPAAQLHTNFPGRTSWSVINALQSSYQRHSDRRPAETRITEHAIELLDDLCKTHGVRLVVGLLDDTNRSRAVHAFAKTRGLSTVDLSVDYSDDRFTNMPHDWHPSALAHRHYATRMAAFFAER